MKSTPSFFLVAVAVVSLLGAELVEPSVSAQTQVSFAVRPALKPLPDHPGNIFLMGEPIRVPIPAGLSEQWQVVDYRGNVMGRTTVKEDAAEMTLGNYPIGYYEVKPVNLPGVRPIPVGIISTLSEPVPADSPIGVDVAMAWFYPPDKMEAAASLAMLAGANWVRDRMNWAELEPQWGVFVARTRYDQSAQAQAGMGLRVLQVGHASPKWANPDSRRFPLDLRHAYHFHQEIARRWKDKVLAFEPWNEADIDRFGGHTGSEMASLQKAAYLGLKAGNPEVIACLNVFATHRPAHLADLAANEAWPYFDTCNFHHYEPIAAYPKIYDAFRGISAGRPLWVTECSVPVPWSDEQTKEPSTEDLKRQAERLVKTFAVSLHQGSAATFYFLLPDYVEGKTQFGLLHSDLTPRPAYLALAAVGRLLGTARSLGQWKMTNPSVQAYWFKTKVGEVLIAWCDDGEARMRLEVPLPTTVQNHLGSVRSVLIQDDKQQKKSGMLELALNAEPVLISLPAGALSRSGVELLPPPAPAGVQSLAGSPSLVVFQAQWPEDRMDLNQSAYRLAKDETVSVKLAVYNFGAQAAEGNLRLIGAEHVQVATTPTVQIASMDRTDLELKVSNRGLASGQAETVRVEGDFGAAGKAVLSFRLVAGK